MKRVWLLVLFFAFIIFIPLNNLFAQFSITGTNTDFTIDFDNTVAGVNESTYDGSGYIPAPSSGQLDSDAWATTGMSDGDIGFGGSATTGDHARGSSAGGVTTGGFYAFDIGSGNYAFGIQPGGSDWAPGTVTLRLQNNTGNTITSLEITYDIYVYNDQDRGNSFNFSHSSDGITFTSVSALDYTSPTTASGSPSWQSTNRNTTLTGLSISDGDFYYLRWTGGDVTGSGSRDEFGLDNIVINANASNNTTVYFSTSSASVNENDGTYNLDVSITNPDATNATSVDVVLISGDATDLDNYTSQTLTFPAGSSTDETVTITITDDTEVEGSEDFVFELQSVSGGNSAGIGSPSQFTLTVSDNDYPSIIINEVDADQTSTDTDEFIELIADVSTSLDNILVVLHNGATGTIYDTYNLDGESFPSAQYGSTGKSFFVLGSSTLSGFTSAAYNSLYTSSWPSDNAIQNAGSDEGDGVLIAVDENDDGNYDDGIDIIIDKIAYVGSGSGANGGTSTDPAFKGVYGSTGSTYIIVDVETTSMGRDSDDLTPASGSSFDYTTIYANDLSPTPGEINGGQSALPVELSSFTASVVNNSVMLNWRTETEVDNYGFQIERGQRSDVRGQSTWEKIGFVNGSGNSNSPKNYTFRDDLSLTPDLNRTLNYRLKQIDTDGDYEYSQVIEVDLGMPNEFELAQNYPNPFNPETKIKYTIPSVIASETKQSLITIKVYDILGKEVATLVNEFKPAGSYEVEFSGSNLASGMYFYQLKTENFSTVKKMILTK